MPTNLILLCAQYFNAATADKKRVVYAEGEEERVLRAVQTVVDEKIAEPILIGRPEVVKSRIAELGLRLKEGIDFELCNPESDARFNQYWQLYHKIMGRDGVSTKQARIVSAYP